MKKILKYTAALICITVTLLASSSCTDKFETWNINPNEATAEQMSYDNLNIGAYFIQMQKGVFMIGTDRGGEYQITEALAGDLFAGYLATITTWSYTTYHNDHYALYPSWYNAAFNDAYTELMEPYQSIKKVSATNSPATAMATIVKILGMSRITDMYGPIPYSKFGTTATVPYDSQKDVYYSFFNELDTAITALSDYASGSSETVMSEYDYIYAGNVDNWIKLGNTLRLRLAMRISNVDESKAKEEAAKAINDAGGLISTTAEAAGVHQSYFTFINPLYEITESWDDEHMSATIDCYMNGYSDPRLSTYFSPASDNAYHGVRNGLNQPTKSYYTETTSPVNVTSGSDLKWMDAAEAYFLLAEAKLRFDLGSETAQTYYEDGIQASFDYWGVSGASSYIASTALPLTTFTDNARSNNVDVSSMLTYLSVAWGSDDDENYQRIILQKWIALFPDGQEAWSEMRRTGYPGWVRIESYSHQTEVADNELISRLKFPTTEYSNNNENTLEAASLLGGTDAAGTRLWWDVKR